MTASAYKSYFIYLFSLSKTLKKHEIIVTIKHSAEVYNQTPKSKATFPFIFYILYFLNKSNIVIHGERFI